MTLELSIALIFVAVAVATFALLQLLFGAERRMASRLRGMSEYVPAERPAIAVAPVSLPERIRVAEVSSRFARRSREMWPLDYRTRVQHLLSSAGRGTRADLDKFLLSKLGYGVVGGLAMMSVATAANWQTGFAVAMVCATAAGGFILPDSRLKEAIRLRRYQIVRELPDVIDMLSISVTAGLGFEAAIAKLVKNSSGLVVSEFERMLKEVGAGASRKQAMRAMAERVDAPEMSAFVSAVTQAESFGTPVASVLRIQSEELRLKRRQAAEEEAQKAPVKMTIPLMLIILPATIMILLGPAVISLVSVLR